MRPARQCRCPKASFATPAGRPIPKVGNAALTAVSTRCGPARMDRSASTCSGRCRSTSRRQGRRMSVAPVPVADVLPDPTPGRRSNSASGDAMVVLNVLPSVAHSSRNVLRSNNKARRKPRGSARDDVAGVAAVEVREKRPLRIRTPPLRSSRGPRVSRGRPVRRRPRVRIRRSVAKREEHRAPRGTAPSDGDVFAGGAVVGAAGRRADRRPRKSDRGIDLAAIAASWKSDLRSLCRRSCR
jgi:hypothetical protein